LTVDIYMNSQELIALTERYSAHNYAPLDVVLVRGEGVWLTDVEGKRYMDFCGAYSAMNFGHCNPRILRAAHQQLDTLTLVSRAFYADQVAYLCKELSELAGKDKVLLMNTGAEAVETSIKAVRRWGYEIKGIPEDKAEIIVFNDNFHGRTTTIVGFSSQPDSRRGFGPFTPGFKLVPYGDAAAVEAAITPHTAAVLVEPILGEGGVILPPPGFLPRVRELCTKHNVLMIADEIWTALGRTGKLFAAEHEGVVPDLYLIGKSLGGGLMPISAVIANDEVMNVFTPGSHGSTLGGNPLACAIAREAIAIFKEEKLADRAAESGAYLIDRLKRMQSPVIKDVRGRGLMIGVEIDASAGEAKDFAKKLLHEGVLCKDTRVQTLRFAPPLIITKEQIDWALDRIQKVFCP
jgi:ornithine--oxo-acid transaminase